MSRHTTKLKELRCCTHYTVKLKDCVKALERMEGDVQRAARYLLKQDAPADRKRLKDRKYRDKHKEDPPPQWAYIRSKAEAYLKSGPKRYRKADALEMPLEEWDAKTFQEIEHCFELFMQNHGWREQFPLKNVSLRGVVRAMETLHFDLMRRRTRKHDRMYDRLYDRAENDSMAVMDTLLMEHLVTGESITLYNL